MALTTILEEQTPPFVQNPDYGGLYTGVAFSIPLIVGEEYIVEWDGTKFWLIAVYYEALGGIGIGNAGLLGLGEITDEPFAIGTTSGGTMFFTSDTANSHTIAIYQGTEDESEGDGKENHAPNDAVILNYSQTPVKYEAIPKVWLTHPSSTEEEPVLVPFTYGEAVSKTVEPDFSGGDMDVPIGEGELVTELKVKQPADLIPENIPSGMYIAGVGPGKYIGSGGGDIVDWLAQEELKYFSYKIDDVSKEIILCSVALEKMYADTGSCNVTIPDEIAGYRVVINSDFS